MTESLHARPAPKLAFYSNLKSTGGDRETISPHIKTLIIDESPARKRDYIAEKVLLRNEGNYTAQDPKEVRMERARRIMCVSKCGFSSDPKELYRPLGEPTLESHQLICETLRLNPRDLEGSQKELYITEDVATLTKTGVGISISNPPRSRNGGSHLKRKLAKSKARVNSVHFGVPFEHVAEDIADVIYALTDDPFEKKPRNTNGIDWGRLELDTEKRTYFMNMYSRFLAQVKQAELTKQQQSVEKTPPISRAAWLKTEIPKDQQENRRKDSLRTEQSSLMPRRESTFRQQKISVKSMEAAMGIEKTMSLQASTQKFMKSRSEFYEQRERLSCLFENELLRMDCQRKADFRRKISSFEIGPKGMANDDLKLMRAKSASKKAAHYSQVLRDHPWYNEFVNRVVSLSGAKSDTIQYEQQLIDQIRGCVEDNIPFKKKTLINLMKTIPKHVFGTDEMQRILRFLKTKENIPERDYVEAIERSGQVYSAVANAANAQ